jgi:hypothetical protein
MNTQQWSKRTRDGAAARRAGGRRRYNAERKRLMWERRFAILRIMHSTDGDLPHGVQQILAERFGVHKCVISRDVAWARRIGWLGDGFTLRCSYRRCVVTIEWTNTAVNEIMKNARQLLKAAKRDRLE